MRIERYSTDDVAAGAMGVATSILRSLFLKGLISEEDFKGILREAVEATGPLNKAKVEEMLQGMFANGRF